MSRLRNSYKLLVNSEAFCPLRKIEIAHVRQEIVHAVQLSHSTFEYLDNAILRQKLSVGSMWARRFITAYWIPRLFQSEAKEKRCQNVL